MQIPYVTLLFFNLIFYTTKFSELLKEKFAIAEMWWLMLFPISLPPHALCYVYLKIVFHSYLGRIKISAPYSLMNTTLNRLKRKLCADMDCKARANSSIVDFSYIVNPNKNIA